jgi:hypothetical protein
LFSPACLFHTEINPHLLVPLFHLLLREYVTLHTPYPLHLTRVNPVIYRKLVILRTLDSCRVETQNRLRAHQALSLVPPTPLFHSVMFSSFTVQMCALKILILTTFVRYGLNRISPCPLDRHTQFACCRSWRHRVTRRVFQIQLKTRF